MLFCCFVVAPPPLRHHLWFWCSSVALTFSVYSEVTRWLHNNSVHARELRCWCSRAQMFTILQTHSYTLTLILSYSLKHPWIYSNTALHKAVRLNRSPSSTPHPQPSLLFPSIALVFERWIFALFRLTALCTLQHNMAGVMLLLLLLLLLLLQRVKRTWG